MKKRLVIFALAIVAFAILPLQPAPASITLTAGQVQTVTVGGSTVDTADTLCYIGSTEDAIADTITARYAYGAVVGGKCVPSSRVAGFSITADIVGKRWSDSTGRSGALTTNQANTASTNILNLCDQAENFALSIGAAAGTKVACQ